MSLLTDTQLRLAIGAVPPALIEGIEATNLIKDVYGCAVYLHIGEVFLPGVTSGGIGSADNPIRQQHSLAEGETAVVRTKESFKLDNQHSAVVFPSSGVSIQGLLMTNPGHVDPGYIGHLHVTVINMGRKPYALVPQGRFLRALVFKLDTPVASPLQPAQPGKKAVTEELLARLSPDFLSVDARTKAAAKKEIDAAVRANQWAQYGLPALAAVLGAVVTGLLTNFSLSRDFEQRITALQKVDAEKRISALEYRFPTAEQLHQLSLEVDRLKRAQSK